LNFELADVSSLPGVLFDVDGTLVDTNYLHTLAWSRSFADVDEWAPMNAIHRLIGMGGDQLVPKLLGHDNAAATARRAVRYGELIGEARPFPGAANLLRSIKREGVAVVLATSAPKDELDILIDLLGVEDVLNAVTSADDVENSKPGPEVFLKAIEAGGLNAARTLAVGDSVWDVEAAGAAGIPCIGVESGGFSRHELSEAGAIAVYKDVAQLQDQLELSLIAQLFAR
jgi:HAD superfamily hydrolase (TIGR01509 family)